MRTQFEVETISQIHNPYIAYDIFRVIASDTTLETTVTSLPDYLSLVGTIEGAKVLHPDKPIFEAVGMVLGVKNDEVTNPERVVQNCSGCGGGKVL